MKRIWQEGREHSKKRDAWPTIQRGRELLTQGSQEEALGFLSEAVQKFPDNAEIRILYASALLTVRPEDGIREVMLAIELDPDEPNRLTRAADLMLSMARPNESREYASRARGLGGSDFLFSPELTRLEADFALQDGNEEAAEHGYRRAVELEPDNEALAINLADFLAKRGRWEDALQVIDRGLREGSEKGGVKKGDLTRLRNEILERGQDL